MSPFLCLLFLLVFLHYNSRLNLPIGTTKHAPSTKVSTDQPWGKFYHAKISIIIDVKPVTLLEKKPCLILSKRLITAIKQLIFDCKLKVLLV